MRHSDSNNNMAYSTRNQNQKFLASLDLPSREVKLAPLTPNAFYRCDKIGNVSFFEVFL